VRAVYVLGEDVNPVALHVEADALDGHGDSKPRS
jgi:hypothetical protein